VVDPDAGGREHGLVGGDHELQLQLDGHAGLEGHPVERTVAPPCRALPINLRSTFNPCRKVKNFFLANPEMSDPEPVPLLL
jgi:hypothetical protein